MIDYVRMGYCEGCKMDGLPVATFDIDPTQDLDGAVYNNTAWLCESCLRTALRFFDNHRDARDAVADSLK